MPDLTPPPPGDLLNLPFAVPGGWWAVAGLAAAGALFAAVLLARLTRRRPEPAGTMTTAGARPTGGLTGTPGGRDPSPPGLPPGGEERLRRVRAVADFLDNPLKTPGLGFSVGWDAVMGLAVPVAGDAATGALALWIVWQARRLGVPKRTLLRMCGNAGVDLAGGAVPLVGDAFDVAFKANRRNLRLIEAHLAKPPRAGRLPG